MKEIFIYILCMNFITFIIYGIDKYKAKKNLWRVPEKTLLLLAIFGGSIGALAAMGVFHHKTRKPKFYIGVPFIIFAQISIVCIIWNMS